MELYSIIWSVVRRLEEIDIHVVCFVSEGSSVISSYIKTTMIQVAWKMVLCLRQKNYEIDR